MVSKKGIYIFTLLGLLLGFTLDGLIRYENTHIFYYVFITLACIFYALAYDEFHLLRLILTSVISALFLALPFLPIQPGFMPIHLEHWFTFICAYPAFVYVSHSFHYAYHHDNTWRINYSSLFTAVWNTICLLFVAVLFAGLADSLIILSAFIFKTVGSDYLWDLYFNNLHFRLISHITLFFIGLGVGQQNINIIHNLRFLLLRMMYYLFPFLAIISIIYFVLYLIHSFTSEQQFINPLVILIPLISLGIIFFNAYFQDGDIKSGVPIWLKFLLRFYRIILFLLVLIMTYKLFQDYSLDINIVICLIIVILFSLTYAVTSWFSEHKEQKWIRLGNIYSGLFFIIVLFLLNLPYLQVAFNLGAPPLPIKIIIP